MPDAMIRWKHQGSNWVALDIHFRTEYQPSYRNRPKELVQIRLRCINHLVTGAEVLNDEFLQLPLLTTRLEREQ